VVEWKSLWQLGRFENTRSRNEAFFFHYFESTGAIYLELWVLWVIINIYMYGLHFLFALSLRHFVSHDITLVELDCLFNLLICIS
jgi:hypothetical protein